MVAAFPPNILHFLSTLQAMPRTDGVERLGRTPGMPAARTIYRWQRSLTDRLVYYPSITYQALGLLHAHLFIERPSDVWQEFRYAIDAAWVVRQPGVRTLYLHCLIPATHERELLRFLRSRTDTYATLSIVVSTDGWQTFGQAIAGLQQSIMPTRTGAAADLLERLPLIIPAVFESIEARRSYPDLWQAIYDRLGNHVWEYFPTGVRRLPHNGATYVRRAFVLLSDAQLVRQHIIRYQPLQEITVEVFLLVRGTGDAAWRFLADAAAIEVYPAVGGDVLVRVSSELRSLSRILSATLPLQVTDCWFMDRTANGQRPRVRFRYEELYDVRTSTWTLPQDLSQ